MPGKAFRSMLEPFREQIIKDRRAGLTWEQIAQSIRQTSKQAISRQAVQEYFKRHRKAVRKPMGMEPEKPKPEPGKGLATKHLSIAKVQQPTPVEEENALWDIGFDPNHDLQKLKE